jgi:protein dithiol:quinone oxidoreductase
MATTQKTFGLISLICISALSFAYILQYGFGQHPCDLCLLQRFALYGVGFFALIAFFHRPQGWGVSLYGTLCLLFSLGGLAAAGRQVYLQSLPEELKPSCGPGLIFRMNHSPWLDALAQAMHGTGDCAQIGWTFLGQSLAVWTGVLFVGLIMMSIFVLGIKKVVR